MERDVVNVAFRWCGQSLHHFPLPVTRRNGGCPPRRRLRSDRGEGRAQCRHLRHPRRLYRLPGDAGEGDLRRGLHRHAPAGQLRPAGGLSGPGTAHVLGETADGDHVPDPGSGRSGRAERLHHPDWLPAQAHSTHEADARHGGGEGGRSTSSSPSSSSPAPVAGCTTGEGSTFSPAMPSTWSIRRYGWAAGRHRAWRALPASRIAIRT